MVLVLAGRMRLQLSHFWIITITIIFIIIIMCFDRVSFHWVVEVCSKSIVGFHCFIHARPLWAFNGCGAEYKRIGIETQQLLIV